MNIKAITFRLTGLLISAIFFMTAGCGPRWTETNKGNYILVHNEGGKTLGYSDSSGVNILTVDRFAFKDLNKNGSLDDYEDWRLPPEQRALDLASRMTIEEIAGLMLYSSHQSIPSMRRGYFGGTYGGKPFNESGAASSDLTDQQETFFKDDHLRHVLITRVESPAVAALWNNNAQAFVEGLEKGIPVNTSSDPRHQSIADEEFNAGSGGKISMWPDPIGLAATFDPDLVREFGRIASIEYRALGISTALSPQVDLATDPRWNRFNGTFGPDPDLSTDMARAYVDGFQTSEGESEIAEGWGYQSVNAMVKHWPGGGTGEGGRDAHYGYGKFAVYPGENLNEHLKPFLEGAFNLEGPTGKASAVMPYYTISFNQDPAGDNVGNAYSYYFIRDLLRGNYGYDGVVCTDWGVTRDEEEMDSFGRTPWGVEHLTESERHYRIIMAGCDQFGGNNQAGPVIEAYQMGVEGHGEQDMRARFEKSAYRLLMNIFRTGLFENPYLDVEESSNTVGQPEFMEAGYDAQLKSIVLAKNSNEILPVDTGSKVFMPKRFIPPSRDWFGNETPGRWEYPVNLDIVSNYYEVTDAAEEADFALVVISTPTQGRGSGYSREDAEDDGNGFLPISLQYKTYTAEYARDPSIAGDSREKDVLNRTYKGKTVISNNSSDLDMVLETRKKMGDKPVVVVLKLSNPTVVAEFEKEVDGLLITFGVQDQAILDILSGASQPSGLLPLQIPSGMKTVEMQFEDVPRDMECHVDTEGNVYDFAFGLNWKGVIQDSRVDRYRK